VAHPDPRVQFGTKQPVNVFDAWSLYFKVDMQLKLHFVVVSLTWALVLPLSVIYVSVKLTCINHDIGRENVYAVTLPASYWQCTLSCQKDEKCLGMDLCQFANGSGECRLRNTSDIPDCLDEDYDGVTCQHIAVVSILT
jgi:hypothetical protein